MHETTNAAKPLKRPNKWWSGVARATAAKTEPKTMGNAAASRLRRRQKYKMGDATSPKKNAPVLAIVLTKGSSQTFTVRQVCRWKRKLDGEQIDRRGHEGSDETDDDENQSLGEFIAGGGHAA
jgi:hypothetical protein